MKKLFLAAAVLVILSALPAYAEVFDAVEQYTCDPAPGIWSYEGYRASDNVYLPMVFEHAPIYDVTKYGMIAHFVPDSDQKGYPFLTRLGGMILASPATKGRRYDAVVTWTAPYDDSVKISGYLKVMGDLAGNAQGKKIKSELLLNDKPIWDSPVTSEKVDLKASADVKKGDKLHLRLENFDDTSGKITALDMKIETTKK